MREQGGPRPDNRYWLGNREDQDPITDAGSGGLTRSHRRVHLGDGSGFARICFVETRTIDLSGRHVCSPSLVGLPVVRDLLVFFKKKITQTQTSFLKKIVRPKPDSVVRGASTGEVKSPDLPRNSGVVRGLSNWSSSWETTHALTCSPFPKKAPSGKTAMPYNCWALGEWEPGTVIAA